MLGNNCCNRDSSFDTTLIFLRRDIIMATVMEGEQHNENFIHQFQLLKIPFIAIHQFLLKSDLSLNVQNL